MMLKTNVDLFRVDILLVKKYNFSRNYVEKLIKNNQVFINGILVKNKHKKYKYNCIIDIEMVKANPPHLKYIIITDDYIVVYKPAGLSCARCFTTPSSEYVLNELVAETYTLSATIIKEEFGLPHRIDKETEGLVLMSRTKKFYDFAIQQFKEGLIKKTYLAIVSLKKNIEFKQEDIININLVYGQKKVIVRKNGIQAITSYKVIQTYNKYKILEISPITGRKHQIRVSLNYIGLPIVGDKIYNGKNFQNLCLFSCSLSFTYENNFLNFSIEQDIKHKINNLLMFLYF